MDSPRFACTFRGCKKTFGEKKNLNQHIKRVHKKNLFKCKVCDEILSSAFRLKEHSTNIHGISLDEIGTKSSLVIMVSKHRTVTSPAAKPYLIEAQKIEIENLQRQLEFAKLAKKDLLKKLNLLNRKK